MTKTLQEFNVLGDHRGQLIAIETNKPGGMMVKLTDQSKLHSLGWKQCIVGARI